MSKWQPLQIIVEGLTEQNFVNEVLVDYLVKQNIAVYATQVSKPQQKGGDTRFERVKIDVIDFLRQRNDSFVSTFVDYYGIHEWPGLQDIKTGTSPVVIADHLNEQAVAVLEKQNPKLRVRERYIPFWAVHEFEALLFSDVDILSEVLSVPSHVFEKVLVECGTLECINTTRETSPSHRLKTLSQGRFKKTSLGIKIAKMIGGEKMREKCFLFDQWLQKIERLS